MTWAWQRPLLLQAGPCDGKHWRYLALSDSCDHGKLGLKGSRLHLIEVKECHEGLEKVTGGTEPPHAGMGLYH